MRVLALPHGGPAIARSAAVAACRGDAIALLDADDRWMPDKLARQVAVLADRPEVDAVFCLVRNVFDGVPVSGPTDPMAGWIPSATLLRREVFERVGDFGDGTDLAADWVPWFMRLRAECTVHLVEEVLVHRRIHGANTGRLRAGERNAYVRHVREQLRARSGGRPT